jgi:predicted ATPase
MLTRLRVKGFKNLVDVDVRFGPFTCIAGPNGVGKSNLFDAILFLRELADKPFVEAVDTIRGEDPALLFTTGVEEMTFIAEMLIPSDGIDDFGEETKAASTFVEYTIRLRLRRKEDNHRGAIELVHEKLDYVRKSEAKSRLGFDHKKPWRDSVVLQLRYGAPFISTNQSEGKVRRHQDQNPQEGKQSRAGRALEYNLASLPRTVLSSARNAQESRTAVLVRREMQSWRLLRLEPSAMHQADDFRAPDHIGHNGSHLPATLYRLVTSVEDGKNAESFKAQLLTQLSNRVAELVQGVETVNVVRDEERKLIKLIMKETNGAELPAASLSDGTLRFLALALIEFDPKEVGVICLEEPENGVHPQRIEAMLRLLQDIAVDPTEPTDKNNPLRQVIVNTHSPLVANLVPADVLLFAQPVSALLNGNTISGLALRCIESTWRTREPNPMPMIAPGDLLTYSDPTLRFDNRAPVARGQHKKKISVRDYTDEKIRQLNLKLEDYSNNII